MKSTLLLSAAVVLNVSAIAQLRVSPNVKTTKVDRIAELQAQANLTLNEERPASIMYGAGIDPALSASGRQVPTSIGWSLLCGSMNTYGMLSSSQKPLQYHVGLDAVSFIHRKSDFYVETPALPAAAESGVILAEVSTNWGASWDSTNIYANANEWGRYPQGAIYNPTGNTSISNAYVIGSGPTVGSASFSGSWYASKKLNTFDATASTVPGAQQFFQFTSAPYPANMNRHAWPRVGFSVTNDGVVHALGILGNDLANTSTMRGYAVLTGTFNGTTFDWNMDSIIPSTILKADGVSKHLQEGQMIWNPAGTVGYVVGIGVQAGAIKANRSYQPIIYKMDKTSGSAATWTLMSQLDFNNTFTVVPDHLPGRPVTYPTVNGDTTAMPFTNDFDLAIDANNDLHIGIVFMSGFSDHPDSLQFFTTFGSLINSGESYRWQHLPGNRPYIYDFIGNGVAPWKMVTVDSISSESPSSQSGRAGYNENPWDASGTGGAKLDIDSRLQMGRTPDGQYILFSWAESDSSFTNMALKYNTMPDIKARLMALTSGTNTHVMDAGTGLNVTETDNNVRARATLHYMSPMTTAATVYTSITSFYTVDVRAPFSVTNSNPFSQLTNNATWFGDAKMSFRFSQPSTVGVDKFESIRSTMSLYPNPAGNSTVLKFYTETSERLDVSVLNTIGQLVFKSAVDAAVGENRVTIDVSSLQAGIYFVSVNNGKTTSTKKLIVE